MISFTKYIVVFYHIHSFQYLLRFFESSLLEEIMWTLKECRKIIAKILKRKGTLETKYPIKITSIPQYYLGFCKSDKRPQTPSQMKYLSWLYGWMIFLVAKLWLTNSIYRPRWIRQSFSNVNTDASNTNHSGAQNTQLGHGEILTFLLLFWSVSFLQFEIINVMLHWKGLLTNVNILKLLAVTEGIKNVLAAPEHNRFLPA